MSIEEFTKLYNSNIRTLIKNNPTDFTEESLIKALTGSIYRLKDIRLDPWATNDEVNIILKEYKKPIKTPDEEIDHYIDTVDSNMLSSLILKYCKREKSYYYAYVRLQQEINCRVAFAEDIYFLSEQEVEDAVINDIALNKSSSLKQEKQFIDLLIHDRKEELMRTLHELLDYSSGKDVVTIVKALKKKGFLSTYRSTSNLHNLITNEFGDIGSLRNFTNFMNDTNGSVVFDDEVDAVVLVLERV